MRQAWACNVPMSHFPHLAFPLVRTPSLAFKGSMRGFHLLCPYSAATVGFLLHLDLKYLVLEAQGYWPYSYAFFLS